MFEAEDRVPLGAQQDKGFWRFVSLMILALQALGAVEKGRLDEGLAWAVMVAAMLVLMRWAPPAQQSVRSRTTVLVVMFAALAAILSAHYMPAIGLSAAATAVALWFAAIERRRPRT